MVDLDDFDVTAMDRHGMLPRLRELPKQCAEGWQVAGHLSLPADYRDLSSILILGMGGSAIGGDLVRTLVQEQCVVPISVNRDYDLPAYAGERTLVIGCSYSGNTEETLATFSEAAGCGCKLLAITTGGKLAEVAYRQNAPVIRYQYPAQPRAALGYSFGALLNVLFQLGLIADPWPDLKEAIAVMSRQDEQYTPEVPVAANLAKSLALALHGSLPVVFGAGILSEVARRWKTQLNENSKIWAFYDTLPELNHNTVVGFNLPADLISCLTVVMLRAEAEQQRVAVRQEITKDLLQRAGVRVEAVQAQGTSRTAQMLSTVFLGDYVSYYLAALYGEDSTPIANIEYLKSRLAQRR